MRTPADFANAAKKAGMTTRVLSVESSADYAALVRILSATVRPFAVAIVSPS